MTENAQGGFDAAINDAVQPFTDWFSGVVFYPIHLFGADVPVIVIWLIGGAVFFTFYLGLINLRGFGHALALVSGRYKDPDNPGEISHFRALTAAISGTVGVGNIAGVAITISLGGPGAAFWLIIAGFLGMATKFAECTLGVKYRRINEDGTVSGGPMYYLAQGLAERGLPGLGKALGLFFAASIVIGCLGIGNMFQSNQAFVQFVEVTGQGDSFFADKGWLFGGIMAALVALIILGGIRSIASVTAKLVPFMILFYIIGCVAVLMMRADALPAAFQMINEGAFTAEGITGGWIGAMILGFQRAVFSNEAGLGSAAIAHSAVQTNEPATEGYVALLEPFIDTVIVCALTALVLTTTIYVSGTEQSGLAGIELTSAAFASVVSWAPAPLSVAAILFAFSTMLGWSYYGLKGWTYIVGEGRLKESIFKGVFCFFVILGCSVQLGAILDFADALVFVMAFPNLLGLYIMAPVVKRELKAYRGRRAASRANIRSI
ncbi:MAG: alanine/glycine:cation symporter family protein [Proteobacteria bacterium]|nr:alanine/glycine:cation symporter family protein [Pseudomonadota bacterium]